MTNPSNAERPLTFIEKTMFTLVSGVIYMLIGLGVSAVMLHFGGYDTPNHDKMYAEDVAVTALWPLFVIKYLLIGLWTILSTGFSLLF